MIVIFVRNAIMNVITPAQHVDANVIGIVVNAISVDIVLVNFTNVLNVIVDLSKA